MENPADILDWVERLGGWGVVVWIVWRMQRSTERLMAGAEEDRGLFREAVQEFRGYRKDDERAHQDITDAQREILHEIRGAR